MTHKRIPFKLIWHLTLNLVIKSFQVLFVVVFLWGKKYLYYERQISISFSTITTKTTQFTRLKFTEFLSAKISVHAVQKQLKKRNEFRLKMILRIHNIFIVINFSNVYCQILRMNQIIYKRLFSIVVVVVFFLLFLLFFNFQIE